MDFDKLEAKIASISRLSSQTNDFNNTSDVNSSIYTSEYTTDDSSSGDESSNASFMKSGSKGTPVKRRESTLTNEGFLNALEKLDAGTKSQICQNISTWRTNYKMTNYIPKSMRQFFSQRGISHQISTRLLKTDNIEMFIDLLEQDEEVKLLNRTATPKSINLSFGSMNSNNNSNPGTPTLDNIDDFIMQLEQEADMEPSSTTPRKQNDNDESSNRNRSSVKKKMEKSELKTSRIGSSSTKKNHVVKNKTPSSKLKIQSTSPMKSTSPKKIRNNNNSHIINPVKAMPIESVEILSSPTPKKITVNEKTTMIAKKSEERHVNHAKRKMELENKAKVTKHILSHVDKMINEEDVKIQNTKANIESLNLSHDTKNIATTSPGNNNNDNKNMTKTSTPQTPTRVSSKLITPPSSASRRKKKKKKNTTPRKKTPIQHTLKLTPKRKNSSIEKREKRLQTRPSPSSRPPLVDNTATVELNVNQASSIIGSETSSSSPIQKLLKKKKKSTPLLKKRSSSSNSSFSSSSSRPVNSQDELNTLLKDAIKSKRSLFGIQLKSLKDVFLAIDKDNSGTIDLEEFQNGIKRLGIILTKKAVIDIMNIMDPSKSGFISYNQWVEQTTKVFKRNKVTRSSSTASHKVLTKKQILQKQKMEKLKALESAMMLAEVAGLEREKRSTSSLAKVKRKGKRKKYKKKSKKNAINTNFYQRAMLWKQEIKDRNDKEKFLKIKMEEEEWETLKTTHDVSKNHAKPFDGSKFYENNLQWQQRKDKKSEKMKNANLLDELAECDFELTAVKKKNARRKPLLVVDDNGEFGKANVTMDKTSSTTATAAPGNKDPNINTSVYDRRMRWKERKMAKLKELMKAKEESIMSSCTFQPELKHDEYRDALANNAKKRRKAREERIAKIRQKELKLKRKKDKMKLFKKMQSTKKSGTTITSSILSSSTNNNNQTTVDDANYLLKLSSKFVSQSRKDRTAMDTTVRKAKRTLKKKKKKKKKV